jgi:hypothetical protein
MKPLTLDEASSNRLLVNTDLLAHCLRLSPRRIDQLAAEAIILRHEVKKDGKYVDVPNCWNLAEVVRDYIQWKLERRGWRQMR